MQPPPLPPKVGAGQRSSFGIAGQRAFPGPDSSHLSPLRESAAAPQPRGVDASTLRSLAFLDDGDEDALGAAGATADAGPLGVMQATPPRPRPTTTTQRVFSSGVHSPGPSGGSGVGGGRRPGDSAGHSPAVSASSPVERFQVARGYTQTITPVPMATPAHAGYSVHAPPSQWIMRYSPEGYPYYTNHVTGQSVWAQQNWDGSYSMPAGPADPVGTAGGSGTSPGVIPSGGSAGTAGYEGASAAVGGAPSPGHHAGPSAPAASAPEAAVASAAPTAPAGPSEEPKKTISHEDVSAIVEQQLKATLLQLGLTPGQAPKSDELQRIMDQHAAELKALQAQHDVELEAQTGKVAKATKRALREKKKGEDIEAAASRDRLRAEDAEAALAAHRTRLVDLEAANARLTSQVQGLEGQSRGASDSDVAAAVARARAEWETSKARDVEDATRRLQSAHAEEVASLRKQLEQMQADVVKRAEAVVADARRAERELLAGEIARLKSEAAEAIAKWKHEAAQRRAIHNRLVDMIGAIRVVARVRPVLPQCAGDLQ